MKNIMRILLVNYRYFISGGPEKYMFNIIKKLEEEGHEVIPFSVHSGRNVESKYSSYFVEPIGGREAIYYEDYRRTPGTIIKMISRSIYSFEVKKALKKLIFDVKPDLAYILHYVNKLSPSVIDAAKEMGLPVVLRLSDYFLLCPRFDFLYRQRVCEDCLSKGYRACIRKCCVKDSRYASIIRVLSMKIHKLLRIYDHIDAFLSPSGFLKEKLAANGFDVNKIHCIPTFTDTMDETDIPAIGSYGLYFGRITEEKGIETIIHAYELLPQNYRLIIAGDDTSLYGRQLKSYVEEKKLRNIEFIGFKSGAELDTVIKDARFTIIPSLWYDNLPNAALESFKFYKPLLASNIGSLPELVIDGYNGYLFEAGDAGRLAELIGYADDDELIAELGRNSHGLLLEKFSADRHYHGLLEIFCSLLPETALT